MDGVRPAGRARAVAALRGVRAMGRAPSAAAPTSGGCCTWLYRGEEQTVMAGGRRAAASASRGATFCIASGCAAALVLGCVREPLPAGVAPVGRSGAPRGLDAAITPARSAAAPAERRSIGGPPTTVGAAAHASRRILCDLPHTAVEAPLFASNDTNLRERGTQLLDDVVACMKAGMFEGRDLLVVGYADPRGGPLYNEAIAAERARAAQRYLIRRGVPPERLKIGSRGERDALGEAPESWTSDRRVVIRLMAEPWPSLSANADRRNRRSRRAWA